MRGHDVDGADGRADDQTPERNGTAGTASARRSRNPPTSTPTRCAGAAAAAGRRLSTSRHTGSAPSLNAASTGSNNGAAWPCAPTNSPCTTRPHSPWPASCCGPNHDPRDGPQALTFGITLALVMRVIVIALGTALLQPFSFMFLAIGRLLVVTAVRLLRHRTRLAFAGTTGS